MSRKDNGGIDEK